MAKDNAVALTPIYAELTTQEAANLLNVSRLFVVKLIQSEELPCRLVGRHHRIRFEDVMDYKQRTDAKRRESLNKLAQPV